MTRNRRKRQIAIRLALLAAVLSVVFIVQKFRRMIEDCCEAEQVTVVFTENKIAVRGLRKKQQENSIISKVLRENPKESLESYEMEIGKIRYYAYDPESGRFRWILGKLDYPDLIVPPGKSLDRIMEKLESIGIRRTGFID